MILFLRTNYAATVKSPAKLLFIIPRKQESAISVAHDSPDSRSLITARKKLYGNDAFLPEHQLK
tara:strand:- start:433 stop:624 length:192 start_codon:yes stop_codon:yes gene_type:complete